MSVQLVEEVVQDFSFLFILLIHYEVVDDFAPLSEILSGNLEEVVRIENVENFFLKRLHQELLRLVHQC